MKVAMVTTTGERCGIAAYSRALVDALCALPNTDVEIVPITEGKQPTEHYVAQAERLNAPDVDVVHIQHEHSFWGGILPRTTGYWELRYLIHKPVVLTAHTTYSAAEMLRINTERRPHKWLGKKILLRNRDWVDSVEIAPFTTAITIVHTAAARNALIARDAKPGYVYIVPTGIPAPAAAPTGGRAFRERFGLDGKRAVTIFGYVAPNKGYELSLSILPSLPQDVTLVIAGGARTQQMKPYETEVRARIEAAGLAKRVVLTGYLSDGEVAEAMEAARSSWRRTRRLPARIRSRCRFPMAGRSSPPTSTASERSLRGSTALTSFAPEMRPTIERTCWICSIIRRVATSWRRTR